MLFCSCVFSSFSVAITSVGEERANLSAFRKFVRLALVWFCLFPLPLDVLEGLRLVIVALPGRFFYLYYLFFYITLVTVCIQQLSNVAIDEKPCPHRISRYGPIMRSFRYSK